MGRQKSHTFRVPINPVPASRPRVSRWSTYYTGPYKTFLKTAPNIIKDAWGIRGFVNAWMRVDVEVFPKRPEKPANPYPSPDWDNFAKAVCDCMEGIVFENDKLIIDGRCTKQYAEPGEDGYIIVHIEEVSPWTPSK